MIQISNIEFYIHSFQSKSTITETFGHCKQGHFEGEKNI